MATFSGGKVGLLNRFTMSQEWRPACLLVGAYGRKCASVSPQSARPPQVTISLSTSTSHVTSIWTLSIGPMDCGISRHVYLLICLTLSLYGHSQAYILTALMPEIISFITASRLSVTWAALIRSLATQPVISAS